MPKFDPGQDDPPTKLETALREVEHYRRLAEECGRRRLREAETASELIARIRGTERALARANEELERRVEQRTSELTATNERLRLEIAERARVELALRESEEIFRAFMKHFPGLAYIKDGDDRTVFANEGFHSLLGIDPDTTLGKTNRDLFAPAFADAITRDDQRVLASGTSERIEEHFSDRVWATYKFVIPRPDGPHLGGLTLDITDVKRAEEERLRLERQVQQQQKLESLGVLAGGIAHDFNNLLTAIVGNTSLMLSASWNAKEAIPCVRDIDDAARRASELCRQMLAYSGRGRFVIEPIDVSTLIAEMLQLLKSSIPKRVTLSARLADRLPSLLGDATQLRQVVMNLIINAAESFGASDGVVTVSTGSGWVGVERLTSALLGEGIPAGQFVWFEVADTGCGMSAPVLERIFEPF